MTRRRAHGAWRVAAAVLAITAFLAIVRPWTVRPIEAPQARTFNAVTYVDGIWTSRVLPEGATSAIPLVEALAGAAAAPAAAGPARRSLFVNGTVRIDRVDTTSRVGLAYLSLPASAGRARVALQIGPVLRGTAVRDALPFIRFTDFDNQIQFANVATAMNDRVLRTVLADITPAELPGEQVTFVAALTPATSADATLELMPIRLDVVRGSHAVSR